MKRILYYHPLSNFARKIRILLVEKKLDYELKAVNLQEKPPEFLKVSPIGKVPVFVEEDGTVIWDSTLIAEYLDETYPEPNFYPTNPQAKLECCKWEELGDNLGDNIINLWKLNLIDNLAFSDYRTQLQTSIDRLLLIFDRQLAKSKYLLGDEQWTVADVTTLCSLGYYNLRVNEDWVLQYDNLKNWFNRLHQRESVSSTVPLNR